MSENAPKSTSIGPPITKKRPFKKLNILSFLASFISKIKSADMFNFLSVRYFSKGLFFLKTWHIRVNYCWNYGPSNLLFRFFRCHLGNLNNRQTKITENWTIPTTKWRSFKFFAKLNGNHILMDIPKIRQYQTFGFIELHNLSKVQLADRIFKLWESCVYGYRAVKHTTFEILIF